MRLELKADICVIGAGSAGLSIAAVAAQLGAKVVLIERGRMGGECRVDWNAVRELGGRGQELDQFCQKGVTPFQAMFARGYYMPRLLVMFFLGNATDRWAGNPADAMEDVRRTMHDLPPDLPCIFMTTAPAYDLATVRIRQRAQANIAAAFESEGRRCTFVEGYTPETIAENRGNSANFRRKPSGKVKDPYHPTEAAARQFLALRRGELCRAITEQMTPD